MAKQNKTIDRIQAVWNILGGEDGVDRLITHEYVVVSRKSLGLITINSDFDSVEFIGKGWRATGTETDRRSNTITEFNPNTLKLITMLNKGEAYISGEESIERLKETEYVRLGIDFFFTLWENKSLIPEYFKERVDGNIRYIFFDGTLFQKLNGQLYSIYLCWNDNCWHWDMISICKDRRSVRSQSAVLFSPMLFL